MCTSICLLVRCSNEVIAFTEKDDNEGRKGTQSLDDNPVDLTEHENAQNHKV